MEDGRASKLDAAGADCSLHHAKPGGASKSPLIGTVCSLDHDFGQGKAAIDRLSVLQHACAHREQLLRTGLGRGAVDHRLKTHRYLLLHRAVYLIDPPTADAWTATSAAVLRFAGDALLSGRSAGALWELVDEMPDRPELTVVGRGAHPLPGLKLHRIQAIDPRDVAWRQGMPVTSPARAIVDLAAVLAPLELESGIAVGLKLGLITIPKIEDAMSRLPHCPGSATLRRLLEHKDFARTRSAYERKLLDLIAKAGLPRPLTNHRVAGHEVDMVWPDRKLGLEFDGFKFHADRHAFEKDRRRDQDLAANGYRVIRITARQLEEEPLAVIARLAAALAV